MITSQIQAEAQAHQRAVAARKVTSQHHPPPPLAHPSAPSMLGIGQHVCGAVPSFARSSVVPLLGCCLWDLAGTILVVHCQVPIRPRTSCTRLAALVCRHGDSPAAVPYGSACTALRERHVQCVEAAHMIWVHAPKPLVTKRVRTMSAWSFH